MNIFLGLNGEILLRNLSIYSIQLTTQIKITFKKLLGNKGYVKENLKFCLVHIVEIPHNTSKGIEKSKEK